MTFLNNMLLYKKTCLLTKYKFNDSFNKLVRVENALKSNNYWQ